MDKKILLKISGELINEQDLLISNIQEALLLSNVKLIIVVGGGNIVRGNNYKTHSSRVHHDQRGMISTVMNAMLLNNMLVQKSIKTSILSAVEIQGICKKYNVEDAKNALTKSNVLICAGGLGVNFISTDTAAVIRSLELNCLYVLKATKVDSIYNKDPIQNVDAKRIDKISYSNVISNNLKVMDMASIAIAQENNMPIKIFSMNTTSLNDIINEKGIFSLIN